MECGGLLVEREASSPRCQNNACPNARPHIELKGRFCQECGSAILIPQITLPEAQCPLPIIQPPPIPEIENSHPNLGPLSQRSAIATTLAAEINCGIPFQRPLDQVSTPTTLPSTLTLAEQSVGGAELLARLDTLLGIVESAERAASAPVSSPAEVSTVAHGNIGARAVDAITSATPGNDSQAALLRQRHANTQYEIAIQHYEGNGVPQDYNKAVEHLKNADANGDARAQNKLGSCYYRGHGVDKDYKEAVKWFQKAANQGNADAQTNLGYCYYHGSGVDEDKEEAVKWYQKAANQGNVGAQTTLGSLYLEGIDDIIEQDIEKAMKWYRKAADQGDADAQKILGNCFYGRDGVEADLEEAVKWYQKAAEQGDGEAQKFLGDCFYYGHGFDADYGLALKWYRRSADADDLDGQIMLAYMFESGYGNKREAQKWFRKIEKTFGECFFLNTAAVESWINENPVPIVDHHCDLRGFVFLEAAAAEMLAKIDYVCCLSLDGLTALSDPAAEALGQKKGELSLNGLTTLSNAAAEALGQHKGGLHLCGIKKLSKEAATALSRNENIFGLDLETITIIDRSS